MADDRPTRPGVGTLVVAGISVLWNACTLWFAHNAVVGAVDPSIAVVDAALALPLLISSGMVAGAAVAVLVVGWLAAHGRIGRTRVRVLAGAAAGLVVGAAAGGLVLIGYGTASALTSMAVAMAVAAAAGGALGGVPWPLVVVAGVVGALVRFGLGLLEGVFSGRLRVAIATDDTVAAQFAAVGRVSLLMALVGGAVAGLCASLYLRRTGGGQQWPAHLAAGATPGLLLLVAEAATRLGGGPLLRLAGGSGLADRIALDYVGANRLSTGLVVLFTGAIVAIVMHGRTLAPTTPGPAPKGRTTPVRGPRRRPR